MGNIKEDVRQKILEQLSQDNSETVHDLDVDVMDGRLTLRGTVPSYEVMRALEENAYALTGVNSVDSAMAIRYPEDITIPTDEEIRKTIESGIESNEHLNASAVEVTVEDGVAALTGSLDAYWKKRLAEDIAASTIGVTAIDNAIHLTTEEEVVDEIIRDGIEKALDENLNVRREWIEVQVDQGIVTLTGTVPDFNAARAAYASAVFTQGVQEVRNDVKVKNQ